MLPSFASVVSFPSSTFIQSAEKPGAGFNICIKLQLYYSFTTHWYTEKGHKTLTAV